MSREQYGEAEYWADQEREAEEIRILAEGLHNTYWINFLLYSDTEEMSDAIEELVHELRRTEAAKNTQIIVDDRDHLISYQMSEAVGISS